jgi:hypothetical protein
MFLKPSRPRESCDLAGQSPGLFPRGRGELACIRLCCGIIRFIVRGYTLEGFIKVVPRVCMARSHICTHVTIIVHLFSLNHLAHVRLGSPVTWPVSLWGRGELAHAGWETCITGVVVFDARYALEGVGWSSNERCWVLGEGGDACLLIILYEASYITCREWGN